MDYVQGGSQTVTGSCLGRWRVGGSGLVRSWRVKSGWMEGGWKWMEMEKMGKVIADPC